MKVLAEDVEELLKRLIRIESVNPSFENGHGETKISSFIVDYLESLLIF